MGKRKRDYVYMKLTRIFNEQYIPAN